MYVDAKTAVRIGRPTGTTGGFEIRVGVHQGSCLSPLLFIIVMDAVSEHIGREVPWDMLYADDLALEEQTETGMQNRFGDWQRTLECKGIKVNINKTETMVCSKVPETVTIKDAAGNTLYSYSRLRHSSISDRPSVPMADANMTYGTGSR